LVLLFVGFYVFLYPKLEIISGYNAKILCSCLFVSELDQKTAEEIDLGFGPLWLSSRDVDIKKKVIKTSVLGLHPKIAIYRDGLGCSLINDREKPETSLPPIEITDKSGWSEAPVSENRKLQEVLMKAFDSNEEKALHTRAVLVLKNGELQGEAYADGITRSTPLLGWSMSKTLTAIMAGVLAKDGFWDLESSLPIESWKETEKENITLENVLNMTTGLYWEEEYGKVSTATKMLYSSNNMGLAASENELEFEPGTNWKYSSGTTNILSFAMAEAFPSEEEYLAFPYERILKPLGAETFVFETDASGHYVGSSYGYASARDWAKLGQLLLNQGNLYGEQIIDTAWVDFMTTPVAESDGVYGGQLWFPLARGQEGYSSSDYTLDGFQGQIVSVLPEENIVIVRLGVMYDEANFDFGGWVREIKEVLE